MSSERTIHVCGETFQTLFPVCPAWGLHSLTIRKPQLLHNDSTNNNISIQYILHRLTADDDRVTYFLDGGDVGCLEALLAHAHFVLRVHSEGVSVAHDEVRDGGV